MNNSEFDWSSHKECPYKGLIPYGEDDAKYFFGREDWSDIIINNLMAARLTLLYGSSGVGKSSLLRAGVASRIKQQARRNLQQFGKPELAVVIFNDWRDDPLQSLKRQVAADVQSLYGLSPDGLASNYLIPDRLPSISLNLSEYLQGWSQAIGRVDEEENRILPGRLLIILDQFEEYFLYHPHEASLGSFAAEFPGIVNNPGLSVNVLISLREDALAKLDLFKSKLPNLFGNLLRIDHLNHGAAIDCIRKPIEEFNRRLPAQVTKATVEPELIKEVLEQVKVGQINVGEMAAGDQEQKYKSASESMRVETPFLQLVMKRLWEAESHPDGPPKLRLETFNKLGGARTIVLEHLQRLMEALPESAKRVAAIIFGKLVTSGLTKLAYPVFELTDPTKLDRAEELVDRQELEQLLAHLSSGTNRILRRVAPSLEQPESEDRYEIFHDVLAPPILKWRRDYQQAAELKTQLATERTGLEEKQENERKRNRNKMRQLGGVITLLTLVVAWLWWRTSQLTAKEHQLKGIEASQQFQAQERGQIDALIKATVAAKQLSSRTTRIISSIGHDLNYEQYIAANLRLILDQIKEINKLNLLSFEDRKRTRFTYFQLSPASTTVATLFYGEGQLMVSDLRGGKEILPTLNSSSRKGKPSSANPIVAFTQAENGNGYRIVAMTTNGQLQVWDRRKGSPRWLLHSFTIDPREQISQAPFFLNRHRLHLSPDGGRLAIAASKGWLTLLNLEASPSPKVLIRRPMPAIALVSFSADGRRLAAADRSGRIRILAAATGSKLVPSLDLPGSSGLIFSLNLAADGRLASASRDGYVRLWDHQGRFLRQIFTGRILQVRFSPDGRLLATANRDGRVMVLDPQDSRKLPLVTSFLNPASVLDVRFARDGRSLYAVTAAGTLHQWQLPPAEKAAAPANQQVSALAFNPRLNGLARSTIGTTRACIHSIGGPIGSGSEARLRLGRCLPLPPPARQSGSGAPSPNLARLAFSPDGQILAGLAWDGSGSLWDRDGVNLGELSFAKNQQPLPPFSGISFSGDGRSWAFVARGGVGRGGTRGELMLCHRQLGIGPHRCGLAPVSGEGAVQEQHHLDFNDVYFLPKQPGAELVPGADLVLSGADGSLCFASLQKAGGGIALKPPCLVAPIGEGELAVSENNQLIGLAGIDGKLHLWQRRNGSYQPVPASPIQVSAGPLIQVSFDPRGQFLAVVSLDGRVSLWNSKGQQLGSFVAQANGGDSYLQAAFRAAGRQLLLATLGGSMEQRPVQDLDTLIGRSCRWLARYRTAVGTPKDVKKSLSFCASRPPHQPAAVQRSKRGDRIGSLVYSDHERKL